MEYLVVYCRKNCEGLQVLLVDERSLIGCNVLGWMEFLCWLYAIYHYFPFFTAGFHCTRSHVQSFYNRSCAIIITVSRVPLLLLPTLCHHYYCQLCAIIITDSLVQSILLLALCHQYYC